MLDAVLAHGKDYVRLIVCDGQGCHGLLRNAIWGNLDPAFRRKIMDTSWFSLLRHKELPGLEDIPNFPFKLCMLGDNPVYCLAGPAHAAKNAAGQALSPAKVLYYGVHFCDPAATLQNSMPVPAYCRKDPMSDRLCSLLSSPWFLISQDDIADLNEVHIPWHLRGFLLWGVTTALCVVAWQHKVKSVWLEQRL